jgi:aldose sugar dehydrogenase
VVTDRSGYTWKHIFPTARQSEFAKYLLGLIVAVAIFCSLHLSYLENVRAEILLTDPSLEVEAVANLPAATAMAFLGQDDILVLAKEGKVYRVENGDISHDPVSELDVDSEVEKGLLGIAVANTSQNDGNEGRDDPRYVFLYYTEKVQPASGNCAEERERNEVPVNRLYRYEFMDNRLTNARMLIEIPVGCGDSLLEDGIDHRQHFGGPITIGPDNNVYLVTGDRRNMLQRRIMSKGCRHWFPECSDCK